MLATDDKKIEITTRTRLGFGWSSTPKRDEFAIDPDDKPSEFGTIGMLEKHIEYIRKICSGGTWYAWSYYVRVDGEWIRLGMAVSKELRSDYHVERGMRDALPRRHRSKVFGWKVAIDPKNL
jgi:hypothetical protein